jgi:hypothetical protein
MKFYPFKEGATYGIGGNRYSYQSEGDATGTAVMYTYTQPIWWAMPTAHALQASAPGQLHEHVEIARSVPPQFHVECYLLEKTGERVINLIYRTREADRLLIKFSIVSVDRSFGRFGEMIHSRVVDLELDYVGFTDDWSLAETLKVERESTDDDRSNIDSFITSTYVNLISELQSEFGSVQQNVPLTIKAQMLRDWLMISAAHTLNYHPVNGGAVMLTNVSIPNWAQFLTDVTFVRREYRNPQAVYDAVMKGAEQRIDKYSAALLLAFKQISDFLWT